MTGFAFRTAESLVQIAPSMASFVEMSGALRVLAADLTKIANDLRLLASGPATGFYEIVLPAGAAGIVDHAGQGQSVDGGDAESGLLPGASASTRRSAMRRRRGSLN